jgi:hypothetical protein
MPEAVHRQLQKEARQKIKSKGKYRDVELRRRAYVYGGMRKTGWKPKHPGTHVHGSGLS